jgi:hypothetical protein
MANNKINQWQIAQQAYYDGPTIRVPASELSLPQASRQHQNTEDEPAPVDQDHGTASQQPLRPTTLAPPADIRELSSTARHMHSVRKTNIVIPIESWVQPQTFSRWDTNMGKKDIETILVKYLGHRLPAVDPNNIPRRPLHHKLWYPLLHVIQHIELPPEQRPTVEQVLKVVDEAVDDYKGGTDKRFSKFWQSTEQGTVYWVCMNRRPYTD